MLLNTRIGISLMSILGAIALLAGAAFALLSDQAVVSGMTVSAGSADIEIRFTGSPTYVENISTALSLSGLYPGKNDIPVVSFDLRNKSSSVVPLKITGKFSASNLEQELSHAVVVAVVDGSDNPIVGPFTLAQWAEGDGIELPGNPVAVGDERTYRFKVSVLTTYGQDPDGAGPLDAGSPVGNEISGQTLNDVSLTFIGTQTP